MKEINNDEMLCNYLYFKVLKYIYMNDRYNLEFKYNSNGNIFYYLTFISIYPFDSFAFLHNTLFILFIFFFFAFFKLNFNRIKIIFRIECNNRDFLLLIKRRIG